VKQRAPETKVPEVNLFAVQQRPREPTRQGRRYLEGALMVVMIVVWAGVGAFVATLFGWHPSLSP
jgi:hypothetical protein